MAGSGVKCSVVCPACLTARPTPASSKARLVMASVRARRVHPHGLQGLRQHHFFSPFGCTHRVTPANSLKVAASPALRGFI